MSRHFPANTFTESSRLYLSGLQQGRWQASIVLEKLGAVVNVNLGPLATVLVEGALISVLKPSPATHVVNQNRREFCSTTFDILNELAQTISVLKREAALPGINVRPDHFHAMVSSIATNGLRLVFE